MLLHPDDISVAKFYESTSVEIAASSRGVLLFSSLLLIRCYKRLLTHSVSVVIMVAAFFLCQQANTTGPCRGHLTTYVFFNHGQLQYLVAVLPTVVC